MRVNFVKCGVVLLCVARLPWKPEGHLAWCGPVWVTCSVCSSVRFLSLELEASLPGSRVLIQHEVSSSLFERRSVVTEVWHQEAYFFTSIMPSLTLGILQAEWGTGVCSPSKGRPEMNLNGRTSYYPGQGLSPAPAGGFKKRSPCL